MRNAGKFSLTGKNLRRARVFYRAIAVTCRTARVRNRCATCKVSFQMPGKNNGGVSRITFDVQYAKKLHEAAKILAFFYFPMMPAPPEYARRFKRMRRGFFLRRATQDVARIKYFMDTRASGSIRAHSSRRARFSTSHAC
jgi:hypothetical protein